MYCVPTCCNGIVLVGGYAVCEFTLLGRSRSQDPEIEEGRFEAFLSIFLSVWG